MSSLDPVRPTAEPVRPPAEPIRRTAEIEELTNLYLIHPAASRLVPLFARLGVTPNAVSLLGMLCGLAAGFAYGHFRDVRFAIAGFVLMIAWHIMDGADGQLARLTRTQSQFGQVLDGISDNVTFLAVYSGLAIALSRSYGTAAYVLAAAAAVCHAIQSASYEVQRQEYDRWGWERKSAEPPRREGIPRRLSPATDAEASRLRARAAPVPIARTPWIRRLFDFLHRLFYAHLSFPVAGVTRKIRTTMATALERQPERAALIRTRYREAFAPPLRRWSLLSANYRTLGIFIAALFRAPEYYFVFEIVGFSAILAVLIRGQRSCLRALLRSLDAAAEG